MSDGGPNNALTDNVSIFENNIQVEKEDLLKRGMTLAERQEFEEGKEQEKRRSVMAEERKKRLAELRQQQQEGPANNENAVNNQVVDD